MSYVLYLYPKNNEKVPFTEKELVEKIEIPYQVALWKGDNVSFDIMYSGAAPGSEYEFHFDVDHYVASCSYSAYIPQFKKVVKDVATSLQLFIEDQQISPLEKIDPLEYQVDDPRSIKAIAFVKKLLEKPSLDLILPASSKYFILFFIVTENLENKSYYSLLLDDGRLYASKVEEGESLKEVLDREVVDLTGSKEYELIKIDAHYDTAPDKKGNLLPRSAIHINVPYFDPKLVKTKYPMKWVEVKIPEELK